MSMLGSRRTIPLTRREKIMGLIGNPYESGLLAVSLIVVAFMIIGIRIIGL